MPLAVARLPLRLIAATMAFDVAGLVLMNALLGAGDSTRVMVVSIVMQWGINLPLAYLFGAHLGYGLLAVWIVQSVYRAIQSGIFVGLWKQGKWAKIQV